MIADVVTGKLDVREAVDNGEGDRSMTTDTSERGSRGADLYGPGWPSLWSCRPQGRSLIWVTEEWDGQPGNPADYNRGHCLDLAQLTDFLQVNPAGCGQSAYGWVSRQPHLGASSWHALKGEITKRGTVDVLRNGVKHGSYHLDLFYGTPSPDNEKGQRPV